MHGLTAKMADKEVDSNFFIFLPRVFSSDPVSDIEKGPRYSCFIGELLSFFLIAQFRGKNRNDKELRDWQKKLLRFLTSVSVSCTDLSSRKEGDINSGSYIACWPQNSSRVARKDDDNYAQVIWEVISCLKRYIFQPHLSKRLK